MSTYEDVRYERDAWPIRKTEMPLGQIPVLDIDGVIIPQSFPIARFLANQFQLAGNDHFKQAKVDAVVDTINNAAMTLKPTDLPIHFQNLEVLGKLYGNDGPYYVGNHLTWADLHCYTFADIILRIDKYCLDKYPRLKQNRSEVEKHPKIAGYLKNRSTAVF